MTVPFRDELEPTPVDGLTCLVEVSRVYGLDWDRFLDADRAALARIYEGLPGWRGGPEGPAWFGDDEDVPPFLKASRIPRGLRVAGVLPEADWWAWDRRLRGEAAGLPCRARA